MKYLFFSLSILLLAFTACDNSSDSETPEHFEDYCIFNMAEDGTLLGKYGTNCDNSKCWEPTEDNVIVPFGFCPNPAKYFGSLEIENYSDEVVLIEIKNARMQTLRVLNNGVLPVGWHNFKTGIIHSDPDSVADDAIYPSIYRVYITTTKDGKEYTTYGDIEVVE